MSNEDRDIIYMEGPADIRRELGAVVDRLRERVTEIEEKLLPTMTAQRRAHLRRSAKLLRDAESHLMEACPLL